MILNHHRDQLQKAVDAQEMHNQKDIIALLLNDFELGQVTGCLKRRKGRSYVSTRLSEIVGKTPEDLKKQRFGSSVADLSQPAEGLRKR